MNIQVEKLEILKMILNTENPAILGQVKNIIREENDIDFWDLLSPAQREEINKGIDELDRGKKYSYEEVIKKFR
jgi:hypothetical protein